MKMLFFSLQKYKTDLSILKEIQKSILNVSVGQILSELSIVKTKSKQIEVLSVHQAILNHLKSCPPFGIKRSNF